MISPERRSYLDADLLPRWHPKTLSAALWAVRACRSAKRDLEVSGIRTRITPPPDLPIGARRGVDAVLRRFDPTCLERSLVKQTWLAHHGVFCDVVIGVNRDADTFAAHAWLDYESEREGAPYSVIHTVAATRP